MVSIYGSSVPHLGIPVPDQLYIKDSFPLSYRAIDWLDGRVDQGFDLLAHFLRDEQVIVEYGL